MRDIFFITSMNFASKSDLFRSLKQNLLKENRYAVNIGCMISSADQKNTI